MKTILSNPLKVLLFFLYINIVGFSNYALSITPYHIQDNSFITNLTPYSVYFKDESGELNLKDILETPQNFTASNTLTQFFYPTKATYWVKLLVSNELKEPLSLTLEIPHSELSTVEVFRISESGGIQQTTSGTNSERIYGDIISHSYLFSIDTEKNKQTAVFIRLKSNIIFSYSLIAYTPDLTNKTHTLEQLFTGLLLGCILGILIYQLVIPAPIIKTAKPVYSLFLFSMFFCLSVAHGYLGILYFSITGLHEILYPLSQSLVAISGIYAVNILLSTRIKSQFANKLTTAILLVNLGVLVIFLINSSSINYTLIRIAATLSVFYLFILSIVLSRKGEPHEVYITVATGIFFAGLLWDMASTILMFDFYIHRPHLLTILFSIQALLLAYSITSKTRSNENYWHNIENSEAANKAEIKAKGELLSQINHKVRTPVSSLLGMSDLLENSPLTPNQHEYVNTIRSSGQEILTTLNDVLDYSNIKTGKLELNYSDFDLNTLIVECSAAFSNKAEVKRIELITHIHERTPTLVTGDVSRLRQILSNILSFSVRHTLHGEISLEVSLNSPELHRNIHFEIKDTGSPVNDRTGLETLSKKTPPKDATIPQHQSAQPSDPDLGLAIAKQLVEIMQGTIGVKENHRGCTFWIDIPLSVQSNLHVESLDYRQILESISMLAVDDNVNMLNIIQQQASHWGVRIDTATNGNDALALIRNQSNLEEPYDIVVLDYEMPGINGLQLAKKISADPMIDNNIVVIMLTGTNMSLSSSEAQEAGICRILTKPISGKILRMALAEELSNAQQ